jgi:hypothetical protein
MSDDLDLGDGQGKSNIVTNLYIAKNPGVAKLHIFAKYKRFYALSC